MGAISNVFLTVQRRHNFWQFLPNRALVSSVRSGVAGCGHAEMCCLAARKFVFLGKFLKFDSTGQLRYRTSPSAAKHFSIKLCHIQCTVQTGSAVCVRGKVLNPATW